MQVKNESLRLWTVRDIPCIPGEVTEIPDAFAVDIVNHPDLKEVKPKESDTEKAKPGRKPKESDAE